jgi:DNA topoisomerase-1
MELRWFVSGSQILLVTILIYLCYNPTWKASAGSEEAHEAIRPTSQDTLHLDGANKNLEPLYHLIFTRTVSCQMADAVFDVRQIRLLSPLSIAEINVVFQAKGSTLVFSGWKAATSIFKQPDLKDTDDEDESEDESDNAIKLLSIGNIFRRSLISLMNITQEPPPRFTEATLIAALEKLGIGRPSTYASILAILKSRKFIQIKKGKLVQRTYKDGVFWGCSLFKKNTCKVFINDDNGTPDIDAYLKKNKK